MLYHEYRVSRVLLSGVSHDTPTQIILRIYRMCPNDDGQETLTVDSTHTPTAHVVVSPKSMQCLGLIHLKGDNEDVIWSITSHCENETHTHMTLLHVKFF